MLPTYGRSQTYLPEFIKSVISVSSPDVVSFAFCVNERDVDTISFLKNFKFGRFEHCVVYENLPSPNLALYWNLLYKNAPLAQSHGTMVSMVGDDMVFETSGWAETILNWVNGRDGIGVYYCNDMFEAHNRCCVNLFVTRKMVEITEHEFMASQFEAEMVDLVWYYVGKVSKNLHYFPNVIIRHNHNRRKPREGWDETFNRLYKVQKQVHDRGGKDEAIALGKKIGNILLSKGFRGDSVC